MKIRSTIFSVGTLMTLCLALGIGTMPQDAFAERGGGRAGGGAERGGGGAGRGAAQKPQVQAAAPSSVRSSQNKGASANKNVNANQNANRNVNANQNVNVNRNINANQNINVNRNVNVDYDDNDWNGGAFVAGAVVGGMTAAAITAASTPDVVVVAAPTVGTVVTTLPSGCATVSVNGMTHYQCGAVYYQPMYSGSSVTYTVVTP